MTLRAPPSCGRLWRLELYPIQNFTTRDEPRIPTRLKIKKKTVELSSEFEINHFYCVLMLYSHVKMMFVMLNCQNKTHTCRNFANLLAFCNLSTTRHKLVNFIKFQCVEIRLIATGHLRACCDILKRPATSLWITSLDNM